MGLIRQTQKQTALGRACREELERAEGAPGGALAANRKAALAYYQAAPRGDEMKNRSQYVSPDTSQMVNAVTAQLLPMLTTDAAVTFKANGAADAEGVQAESLAVADQIMERNDGTMAIQEAVRDALLMRNGVLKVYAESEAQVRKIRVPDSATALEMAAILTPQAANEDRRLDADSGVVTITLTNIRFTFCCPPIENMRWRANWPTREIEKIPFIAERVWYTRSDLVGMGVKRSIVDQLPRTDGGAWEEEGRNRDWQSGFDATSRDQDVIECHECYILRDDDGDGISERHRVLLAGDDVVLEDEVVEWVPYAIGCAIVMPHRLTGESMYDHLRRIQDGKTWVTRQWFDNLAMHNGGRLLAHETLADLDDLMNGEMFSPIRVRDMSAVQRLDFLDTGASNLSALQYLDQRRTESGGAALDMMGAGLQIAGETAHGVERQYASREMMVALYASNLAETLLRPAWLLMHRTMRAYANAPIEMEISGTWQGVNPAGWPERVRAKVTAGMSVGQRMHIQAALQQAIQLHAMAQQNGKAGILSDNQTLYRTITRWLQLAGIEDPDSFWIDPSSPQAVEAVKRQEANAQAEQQAMQKQMQQQLAQQQEAMAAQLQLAMDQIAADLKKHREELDFKYAEARLKAETEEAKLIGGATLDLEKQQNDFANRRAGAGPRSLPAPDRGDAA